MSSGEGLSPEHQAAWNELIQGLSGTFSDIEEIARRYSYRLPDHELLEHMLQRQFDEIDQGYVDQAFLEIQEDEQTMPEPCIIEHSEPREPHRDGEPLDKGEQAAWESITQKSTILSLKKGIFPKHEMDSSGGGCVYVPLILDEMRKMDNE